MRRALVQKYRGFSSKVRYTEIPKHVHTTIVHEWDIIGFLLSSPSSLLSLRQAIEDILRQNLSHHLETTMFAGHEEAMLSLAVHTDRSCLSNRCVSPLSSLSLLSFSPLITATCGILLDAISRSPPPTTTTTHTFQLLNCCRETLDHFLQDALQRHSSGGNSLVLVPTKKSTVEKVNAHTHTSV